MDLPNKYVVIPYSGFVGEYKCEDMILDFSLNIQRENDKKEGKISIC